MQTGAEFASLLSSFAFACPLAVRQTQFSSGDSSIAAAAVYR
jgi:hypothetical protein